MNDMFGLVGDCKMGSFERIMSMMSYILLNRKRIKGSITDIWESVVARHLT